MARITSKSKSQLQLKRKPQRGLLVPVRLCIIFSLVAIIFVIAFLLYQTDQAMFRQKIGSNNNNAAKTIQGQDRSMQKNILLSHQQQQLQQQHRMKSKDNNNLRLKKSTAEESKQQQKKDESGRTRRVEFDLSNLKDGKMGTIRIETYEEWAPLGVQRFWELIQSDFYVQCQMFRVVPNFIAQFGIASLPTEHAKWQHDPIHDDPVIQSNVKNTITFAMSGKNTRTTQLFINMKDNTYLDAQGFAPIGKITAGMEYISQINDQYKELPKQNKIVQEGNVYLDTQFPGLTYISAIRVVSDDDKSNEEAGDDGNDKEEEEEEEEDEEGEGDDKKESKGDDTEGGDDKGGEEEGEEKEEEENGGDDKGEEEEEEEKGDDKAGDDKET